MLDNIKRKMKRDRLLSTETLDRGQTLSRIACAPARRPCKQGATWRCKLYLQPAHVVLDPSMLPNVMPPRWPLPP